MGPSCFDGGLARLSSQSHQRARQRRVRSPDVEASRGIPACYGGKPCIVLSGELAAQDCSDVGCCKPIDSAGLDQDGTLFWKASDADITLSVGRLWVLSLTGSNASGENDGVSKQVRNVLVHSKSKRAMEMPMSGLLSSLASSRAREDANGRSVDATITWSFSETQGRFADPQSQLMKSDADGRWEDDHLRGFDFLLNRVG